MSHCEIPEFYEERFVKARKPHRCCETGRIIHPGEKYWRLTGKWDGTLHTYAQSEAAYHFARFINGVGSSNGFDGESCIPFGQIGAELPPDYAEEWARVKAGEVTRWTLKTPRSES